MEKIIYFDEESVTDYVQVKFGGNLEKTTELLKETKKVTDPISIGKMVFLLLIIYKSQFCHFLMNGYLIMKMEIDI